MIKSYITIIFLLTGISLVAQSVSSSEIQKTEGSWAGTLSYTDYSDDVTTSSISCSMEIAWKKNKGILTFLFVEPDGRIIKDKTKIALKKNGSLVAFDGTNYTVEEFSQGQNGAWKLIMNANSKDNNQNAEIKMTMNYEANQLLIKKLVRYEGTNSFFERNSYSFKRKD